MSNLMRRLTADRSGATGVEYALIIGLIFLAVLGALQTMGGATAESWNSTADAVTAAGQS